MKIAFIGLGAMGSRMARNLLDAGHELVVYSRNAERTKPLAGMGARAAGTPRKAATDAEMVISMVTDDAASRAVWMDANDGAIHGLREDALAVTSSTLTLDWTLELSEEVASLGGEFLDAPVAGSRPQAEAQKLIFFVGGNTSAFERALPVLQEMGGAIHHVGAVGQGMLLKLVINAMFGIQVAAIGELLGLIDGAGLDREKTVGILNEVPVISPAIKGITGLMLARQYTPMFPIDLVEKDFRNVLATASSLGVETPTTAAVRDVYADAITKGFGGDNIAGVAQLFDKSTSK